jgi:hypothetical protein
VQPTTPRAGTVNGAARAVPVQPNGGSSGVCGALFSSAAQNSELGRSSAPLHPSTILARLAWFVNGSPPRLPYAFDTVRAPGQPKGYLHTWTRRCAHSAPGWMLVAVLPWATPSGPALAKGTQM